MTYPTEAEAREQAYYDIVFDGPPGPVSGRFVEVEDEQGRSFSLGKWLHTDDGYWRLRVPREDEQRIAALVAAAEVVCWENYNPDGPQPSLDALHVALRALAGQTEATRA